MGGVRKTIIVDLTSGQQPRWVARYEKWMGGGGGGGGGGCCECPLETILYQTSTWDGTPTVLHCLSLCLTVLRCNMQISRIKAVDNGAGAVLLN